MVTGCVADWVSAVRENGFATGRSKDVADAREGVFNQLGKDLRLAGRNEFWFVALQLDQTNVEFEVRSRFTG